MAIFCESNTIAAEFYATFGASKIKLGDRISKNNLIEMVKFVSAVRKELGVDKKGFTGNKYQYIFPRPVGENEQKDKEPTDEQKQ